MSNLASCAHNSDLSYSSCALNNNYGYSDLASYYSGFQAPLGSQLSLLNAVAASDAKMNLSRTSNDQFRVARVPANYSSLSGAPMNNSVVSYATPLANQQSNLAGSVNYFTMNQLNRQ